MSADHAPSPQAERENSQTSASVPASDVQGVPVEQQQPESEQEAPEPSFTEAPEGDL